MWRIFFLHLRLPEVKTSQAKIFLVKFNEWMTRLAIIISHTGESANPSCSFFNI